MKNLPFLYHHIVNSVLHMYYINMWRVLVALVVVFSLVAQKAASTSPAFLWSPYQNGIKAIEYQNISPKILATSVLSEGRWSKFLNQEKALEQQMDLVIMFVGEEPIDISGIKHADSILVEFIKVAVKESNFSISFPYLTILEDEKIENYLISGLRETIGQSLGVGVVAHTDGCSVEGENLKKLSDLEEIDAFVHSRMKTRPHEETDVILICKEHSHLLHPYSDGKLLSTLINNVHQSGTKYTVLYTSGSKQTFHPPYKSKRFLTENISANGTAGFDICDGTCLIKSSLLEGLFVGAILLVILISGLCCMMGIDSPSRFESPQDS